VTVPTSPTETQTATFSADSRFGIITSTYPQSTDSQLGLVWSYGFHTTTPQGTENAIAQISLKDGRVDPQTLQDGARNYPGSYWIIGNEPNVGDGAITTGAQYATEFQYYYQTIKSVDPTAKLVGPNILNWDNTCNSCPNFPSGRTWVGQFLAAWTSQYGGDAPIDVWSLHAYSEDYTTLFANKSLTDPAALESDITGMSNYLSGIPGPTHLNCL
jgi:hypothetical protein